VKRWIGRAPRKTPLLALPPNSPCALKICSLSDAWLMLLSLRTCGSRMLVPMPSSRHVSLAMTRWSPVTILTMTPFSPACSMVCLVSGRGGSNRERMPRNSHCGGLTVRDSATPSARKPRSPSICTSLSTFGLSASLSLVHRRRMTCGAPLETRNSALVTGSTRCASVRLSVGLKGVNLSSSKACMRRSSSGFSADVMTRSMASWLPFSRLEASAE